MKPTSSLKYLNRPAIDLKNDYSRGLGEQAALYTFTKTPQKKIISYNSQKHFPVPEDLKKPDQDYISQISPTSRDVSYLKDKIITPSYCITELPSNMNSIRELVEKSL